MLVRYQAAPRPGPHGLYVALRCGSRGTSAQRLPDRLQPGSDPAKRGQRLGIRRRQLELLVALATFLLEALLRALQREPVLVEETLDAQDHLHVVLPVHALPRVVFPGSHELEFRFPVAQPVGWHAREVGALADSEEQLVRDRGLGPYLHGPPIGVDLRLDHRWFTCAFSPLDGLNVKTRRAVISISLPVCGLRP